MARRKSQRGNKSPGGPGGRGHANQRINDGVNEPIDTNNIAGQTYSEIFRIFLRSKALIVSVWKKNQAEYEEHSYRPHKWQCSSDNDFLRPKNKLAKLSREYLAAGVSTQTISTQEVSTQCGPRHPRRSKRGLWNPLLALSASQLRDQYWGSATIRKDREGPKFQFDCAYHNVVNAQH
jgi:hypothetical protein